MKQLPTRPRWPAISFPGGRGVMSAAAVLEGVGAGRGAGLREDERKRLGDGASHFLAELEPAHVAFLSIISMLYAILHKLLFEFPISSCASRHSLGHGKDVHGSFPADSKVASSEGRGRR